MIIQIRGTSGSGKTTVVRNLLGRMENLTAVKGEGRKRPLYYLCSLPTRMSSPVIAVLGSYESTCGGCDNVGSAPRVYELTQEIRQKENPDFIIQEGLLLSEDTKWTGRYPKDTLIYYLDTLPETCLERVKCRREAAGNDKPLNPKNTLNRVPVIARSRVKLEQLGYRCLSASAKGAELAVWNLMRKFYA